MQTIAIAFELFFFLILFQFYSQPSEGLSRETPKTHVYLKLEYIYAII